VTPRVRLAFPGFSSALTWIPATIDQLDIPHHDSNKLPPIHRPPYSCLAQQLDAIKDSSYPPFNL
jgi:hypothetical protein